MLVDNNPLEATWFTSLLFLYTFKAPCCEDVATYRKQYIKTRELMFEDDHAPPGQFAPT